MENPYHVLGVEKSATNEQIKRAYRKKAQKAHPDKSSGNKDEFQKVQRAYDVIGDTQRRLHYDKTGRVEQPNVEDRDALVRQNVMELLLNIILNHPQSEFVDVVAIAQKSAADQIMDISHKIDSMRRNIARTEKAMKRVSRKSGTNYIVSALEAHGNNLRQNIESAEEKLEFTRCVQKELGEFRWDQEMAPPQLLPGGIVFMNSL